jgi:CubicO group peptidase (beta-lactamase class C family)
MPDWAQYVRRRYLQRGTRYGSIAGGAACGMSATPRPVDRTAPRMTNALPSALEDAMNTISSSLAIVAVALCAGCGVTPPYEGSSSGPTAEVAPRDCFAAALQEHMPGVLASHRVPGAVVSYIKNGEVAWTKAFGIANLQAGTPMRPDMVFNHGSNGKVMTAWALMRLVEAGKVELDAPANRYLKRWQIRSTTFDANGVTPRRLLSHTAGLTVHGFADYEQGARLPSLVDVLEGKNQDDGAVYIGWEPGSTMVYSGGGYVIAQMIIEDVSGQPFAAFMEREVAKPLGLSSLGWVWTPQLERRAPTPYDGDGKPVGYRQLASQAIGSEICTVPDFARFVAATVSGPGGEPPGRGVLKRETISTLLETFKVEKFLGHSGANPGWYARLLLNVDRREGFVIANNSSRGGRVNDSVGQLWSKACRDTNTVREQR